MREMKHMDRGYVAIHRMLKGSIDQLSRIVTKNSNQADWTESRILLKISSMFLQLFQFLEIEAAIWLFVTNQNMLKFVLSELHSAKGLLQCDQMAD